MDEVPFAGLHSEDDSNGLRLPILALGWQHRGHLMFQDFMGLRNAAIAKFGKRQFIHTHDGGVEHR
jgi:hypothetical protein